MKRIKKVFIVLVTVLMISLLFGVNCFADEKSYAKYNEGTGYVAFGDSFTRGYGASDDNAAECSTIDSTKNPNSRNVQGSFPLRVAEAMGLIAPSDIRDTSATYWPLAHNAVTTAYYLDLLGIDDGFYDDEYIYENAGIKTRYKTDLTYFGNANSYNVDGTSFYGKTGSIINVQNLVKNASLITVELGMGDVFQRPFEIYIYDKDMSDISVAAQNLVSFLKGVEDGFTYFKKAYRLLLDYFKQANPDATVVLVGAINPVADVTLWNDSLISVGTSLSLTIDLMNKFYRECAKEYGYIFVDISNVETPSSENGLSIAEVLSAENTKIMGHTSKEGYAQIARLILQAIDEKDAEERSKTNIKVDTGRIKSLDYVLVDGIKTNDYTFVNNYLVINNQSKLHNNLTVAAYDDAGNLQLTTYNLTYDKDTGYIVKKLYTTTQANKVVKETKTLVSAIKSAFSKLFKK